MVPSLLCTLLIVIALSTYSLWQLKMIIYADLAGVGRDGLHVQTTAVHR